MSSVLLSSARISDRRSPYAGQVKNILIENGKIVHFSEPGEHPSADRVVKATGLCVAPGFFDLSATVGEPGNEHKETFESVRPAALAGGFTDLLVLSDSRPAVQNRQAVSFIHSQSVTSLKFHVLAAATENAAGEAMTEIYDLHTAGAKAFGDGRNNLNNKSLIVSILRYLQHFDGLLINRPYDSSLSPCGDMHEGSVSTSLGLKGLPVVSETLAVSRDLDLLRYSEGKIHFSCISSAESLALIRNSKAEGLAVSCDVAAHQLYFNDSFLHNYDTNFRLMPPLRSENDRLALLAGLADGTIDAVVSDHCPQDAESKNLEFDLAEFGAVGLETAFGACRKATADSLSLEDLSEVFAHRPREILGLKPVIIDKNQPAVLSLFTDEEYVFSAENIRSLSKNTPFVGRELRGKILGTIRETELTLLDSTHW